MPASAVKNFVMCSESYQNPESLAITSLWKRGQDISLKDISGEIVMLDIA